MKRIDINNYNSSMGILIDVRNPNDASNNPIIGSINIYADKLLMNYKVLLDPNKKYFIVCDKGVLSRKVVAILEYYGYNVTQVIQ